ncbi:substrate-binding domain-containing protein [Croceiramulus getboli]|nr:substrate-binding domain-containing protein [Flavobacteriaceae bacterium YJPT1-3]
MTTIRIGGVPEHFNLPFHLALEEGLFERSQLDVKWKMYPEGTGAMNRGLRTDDIDLAVILTGGIIKDIAHGNPSKIIQMYVSSPLLWGIHVAAGSPFQKLSELENKRVAISRYGSGSHVMAHALAKQQGWDPDQLSMVVVNTLEGAVEALTKGKADFFMWEHFTTKPLVDQSIFRRITDFPTPWSSFVIAGREKFIADNGEALNRFLEVINTVTEDFKRIPSIDKTLSNRYGQELEDIQKWLSMTKWSQSQITPEEINLIQKRLLALNMIDSALPAAKFVTKF